MLLPLGLHSYRNKIYFLEHNIRWQHYRSLFACVLRSGFIAWPRTCHIAQVRFTSTGFHLCLLRKEVSAVSFHVQLDFIGSCLVTQADLGLDLLLLHLSWYWDCRCVPMYVLTGSCSQTVFFRGLRSHALAKLGLWVVSTSQENLGLRKSLPCRQICNVPFSVETVWKGVFCLCTSGFARSHFARVKKEDGKTISLAWA